MAAIEIGRFSWDASTGTLSGPRDFMLEQGNSLLDAILDGQDALFNATAHLSPTIPLAVLVRLQTAFAGWLGQRELLRRI